jgi:hypothetical protein
MMPRPIPTPRTTLIADIDTANRLLGRVACQTFDRSLLRILAEQLRHLQHKAAVEFAILNGWKMARSDYYYDGGIFDHALRFRADGKVCAIVGQPYAKDFQLICEAQRRAAQGGRACHVPPYPWASFHFPNWTQFILFCDRDHEPQWLPEQVGGLAWSSAL